MRWLKLVLRVFGWLLTPFLAWAASFFGALAGAIIAMRVREPRVGLVVTAVTGAIVGFVGIVLWLRLLRRSPQIREALAVQSDGTPDIVAAPDEVRGAPGMEDARITNETGAARGGGQADAKRAQGPGAPGPAQDATPRRSGIADAG
jgi:hypothetical protein